MSTEAKVAVLLDRSARLETVPDRLIRLELLLEERLPTKTERRTLKFGVPTAVLASLVAIIKAALVTAS